MLGQLGNQGGVINSRRQLHGRLRQVVVLDFLVRHRVKIHSGGDHGAIRLGLENYDFPGHGSSSVGKCGLVLVIVAVVTAAITGTLWGILARFQVFDKGI